MTESHETPRRPARTPPPVEREGGDAACWAHRVCQQCGRLNGVERPVVCENCSARFDD